MDLDSGDFLKDLEQAYIRGYYDAQASKTLWGALDCYLKELCSTKSFDDQQGDVCNFKSYETNN